MIKEIFVDAKNAQGLEESGANSLMVVGENLDGESWQKLKDFGFRLSIAFGAFDYGGCPASAEARIKLIERIKKTLAFNPETLWLDHFRFDGHWEAINGVKIPGVHKECSHCRGKNRVGVLGRLASEVMIAVGGRVKVGYFAVPFKTNEVPELLLGLGQDHAVLGKIFDLSSPMLYHRMIKRPVSYISDFIEWMASTTEKPVLPIIQVKDMPDNLPDALSEEEIQQAFNEAIKPPSAGVAFFWWTHALEKNKTEIISKLFSLI